MSIDCIGCLNSFSTTKIPKKLRNCNHSLCQKCLISLTVCPKDGTKIDLRKYTMKGFQINQQILNSLQNICKKDKNDGSTQNLNYGSTQNLSNKQNQTQRISQNRIHPPYSAKSILSEKITNKPYRNKKQQTREIERCLLHDKVADVLCLDCSEQVCANCALFGDHKGHKIDSFQSFVEKLIGLNEFSQSLLKQVREKEECLNTTVVSQYISDCLNEERANIVKNIKQFSTKMIEKIRKVEKNAISQLDKAINDKKNYLLQKVDVRQLQTKTKQFYQQVDALSEMAKSITYQKNITLAFKYFDERCQESYVTKNGQYLKIQYSTLENMHKTLIDNQVKNIATPFDQNLLDRIDYAYNLKKQKLILQNLSPNHLTQPISCTKIYTPAVNTSKNCEKPTEDEDILLDVIQFQQSNILSSQFEQFQQQSNRMINSEIVRSIQMNKFTISSSVVEGVTSTTSINKKYYQNNDNLVSLTPVTNLTKNPNQRNIYNSLCSSKDSLDLQLSSKYKSVLDDLKQDKSEDIDFSGAELGDDGLIKLCSFINRTKKVRKIKLLKNKLTDASIENLLRACQGTNINSLNLAYNLLTEKTLQLIENCDLGELKNITLNFNKINRKNLQSKLDVLLKKNTIVSM